MNYKLKTPLQPSGKMRVTPSQSEALQKELFKMGYDWRTSTGGPQFLIDSYIFWKNNKITYDKVKHEVYFKFHLNPLHVFEDYFETENGI